MLAPSLSWRVISEAPEPISIKFGIGGMHRNLSEFNSGSFWTTTSHTLDEAWTVVCQL